MNYKTKQKGQVNNINIENKSDPKTKELIPELTTNN